MQPIPNRAASLVRILGFEDMVRVLPCFSASNSTRSSFNEPEPVITMPTLGNSRAGVPCAHVPASHFLHQCILRAAFSPSPARLSRVPDSLQNYQKITWKFWEECWAWLFSFLLGKKAEVVLLHYAAPLYLMSGGRREGSSLSSTFPLFQSNVWRCMNLQSLL